MKFLLYPFTLLYSLTVRLRNLAFDSNLLAQTSFDVPVVGVGNLRVGGTGKTPMIAYLLELTKAKYQVAMVSRGYGRRTTGLQNVSKDSNPEQVGDEPLMLKQRFPEAVVAVSEKRVEGIEYVLDHHPEIDVVFLDDAMQHRQVKPGKLILLTTFQHPYYLDSMLPGGRLREPRAEAARADIIVVTKCPPNLSSEQREQIQSKLRTKPHQLVCYGFERYTSMRNLRTYDRRSLEDLRNASCILVTGLADASNLRDWASQQTSIIEHFDFGDHHTFRARDMQGIEQAFAKSASGSPIILTTEKDAVRLRPWLDRDYLREIDIFALEHAFELFPTDKTRFDQTILEYVESSKPSS